MLMPGQVMQYRRLYRGLRCQVIENCILQPVEPVVSVHNFGFSMWQVMCYQVSVMKTPLSLSLKSCQTRPSGGGVERPGSVYDLI